MSSRLDYVVYRLFELSFKEELSECDKNEERRLQKEFDELSAKVAAC